MRMLLDTQILVYWCSDQDSLTPAQLHVLGLVSARRPVLVADISLWEIATLAGLGRTDLRFPVREWLARAVAPPLVRVTPSIAGEIASLSEWSHRDPADRLIVATARVYGASVVTNDERIRDSGLVAVV